MTPSEELAVTQDLQENKSEILKDATNESDEETTSSAGSSTNAFRVKQVSEINQNADEAICERSSFGSSKNNCKRKLPSWMISSNDKSDSEKYCNANTSKRLKNSASDLEEDVPISSNTEIVESSKEGAQPDSADGPSSSCSKKTEVKAEALDDSHRNNDPQSLAAQQNGKQNPNSNAEIAENSSNERDQSDSACNPSSSSSKKAVEVKAEPMDDSLRNDDPQSSLVAQQSVTSNPNSSAEIAKGSKNEREQSDSADSPSSSSKEAVEVKTEPIDDSLRNDPQSSLAAQQNGTSNPVDIKPAVSVKKEEATSTSRESCKFGIRCYRRNPMHRVEEAHPGDHDYKRPNFPTPPKGTPDCPYGDSCYRRNPIHFQQFYHPPETDFEQNWKNYRMRLRQRRQAQNNSTVINDDNSDLDDYDLEDPFIDDGDDEDYIPSDEDEDADYDDCDKAEE